MIPAQQDTAHQTGRVFPAYNWHPANIVLYHLADRFPKEFIRVSDDQRVAACFHGTVGAMLGFACKARSTSPRVMIPTRRPCELVMQMAW